MANYPDIDLRVGGYLVELLQTMYPLVRICLQVPLVVASVPANATEFDEQELPGIMAVAAEYKIARRCTERLIVEMRLTKKRLRAMGEL